MQIVLVVGVGRSGTTLLQRVLNTMPSTNICGENRHAWLHAARLLDRLLRLRTDTRVDYEKPQSHFWYAWYNVADKTEVIEAMRKLFLVAYAGNTFHRIGFKEIRMGQNGYEELEAELEFFRLLFPNLKIIFNLRDANAILRSQHQVSGEYGHPAAQQLFERYAQEHGALLWHYEDWHLPQRVRRIYEYLDEPFTDAYKAALEMKTQ